jgi:ABC-type nitrate/sulfonate/bicarbonate transport system substrate-binding protein
MINRRQALALAAGSFATHAWSAPTGLTPLTMQSSYINDPEFIGYFIAIEKGYYRSRGVDFTYRAGGPDIISESALFSRRADIALTNLDTTVSAITKQSAKFKIIGSQFQKNPLGVISLSDKPVRSPKDLVGKTLSAPPVTIAMMKAFLRVNGLPPGAVRVVPDVQSDPTALLTGLIDAAVGFVSDFPFLVRQHGKTPVAFLLGDYGMPQFIDLVVVTEDVLKAKRAALVQWLGASRQGWNDNFRDPSYYPKAMNATWLKPSGRSVAYNTFSNMAYADLMLTKNGVYSMSEDAIARNIEAVGRLGIKATRAMFDTTLLQDVR